MVSLLNRNVAVLPLFAFAALKYLVKRYESSMSGILVGRDQRKLSEYWIVVFPASPDLVVINITPKGAREP